ncbi:hypothetical protein [Streptomyces sp. NPDC050804]|uniref:hypothetical protein n=1 Tax=Streptomyces sp. NPDC050804 TaxID=3154745 RepID=UPI003423613F
MNAVRNDGIEQEIGYGIRPRGGALKRPGERYGSGTGAPRGPYGSGAGRYERGTGAVREWYRCRTDAVAGPYGSGGKALEAGRVRGAGDGSVT